MIVNSPRIFGRRGKFFTMKSKVLKRRKNSTFRHLKSSPLAVIVALILVPAILFGCYHLMNELLIQSRFVMKKIVVEGNQHLTEEAILSAANVERGSNLFKLNIYKAKKSIEKMPQVLSASIRRELPDTVIIQVAERKPRLVIMSKRSEPIVSVDPKGVLLPSIKPNKTNNVTSIYGIELEDIRTGDICAEEKVWTALRILGLRDCSMLSTQVNVEEIWFENNGDVRLTIRDIQTRKSVFNVRLGKKDFPQRMANLIEILKKELKPAGPRYRTINLKYNRPASASLKNG